MRSVKLSTLKPGMSGTISEITSQRLMEMGLTVGAEVEVAHEAPFGGAIAVRCRGTLVAVRLTDAAMIRVNPS
jgi:Fe2+ transport system protein FeoA